jgi:hypothetical protein
MNFRLEWRVGVGGDVIVEVGDDSVVKAVHPADEALISSFLTDMRLLGDRRIAEPGGSTDMDVPDDVVMSRALTGAVLEVEPEMFWDGIHRLFRSRGVDYDSDTPTAARPRG